jgi:4-hydroxythreonine-4-phosphate dehydrogenase
MAAPWIGISFGDATGIGPEVALKALANELPGDDSRYLLIGDTQLLHTLNQKLGLRLELLPFQNQTQPGRIFSHQPFSDPLPSALVAGSPAAARAAVACLEDATDRCLRRELQAMVTAPVNKESIIRAGYKFIGQTEFLSQRSGVSRTAMMLLGEDDRGRWLRVALATIHIPLRQVSDALTKEKIELVIALADQACRDLELSRRRVAVCGVNPHAGEGGEMGDEEQTIIAPAVAAARQNGYDAVGPLSADALFYYALRGDYDAVVAMYHDQGLAPLKMACFETGVNWTLGLPFIRTSPDHGTAYDIAGQGKANSSSMIAAIRLAKQLAKSRRQ